MFSFMTFAFGPQVSSSTDSCSSSPINVSTTACSSYPSSTISFAFGWLFNSG